MSLAVGVVLGAVIASFAAWQMLRVRAEQLRIAEAAKQAEEEARRAAEVNAARFEERASQIRALEGQLGDRDHELEQLRKDNEALRVQSERLETTLENERANLAEQKQTLEEAKAKLTDVFGNLAAEALGKNNQQFLDLAKQHMTRQQEAAKSELESKNKSIEALIKPLAESLQNYQSGLQKLDTGHAEREAKTREQLQFLTGLIEDQKKMTTDLRGLIKGPTQRGRIGEMLMENILKEAGLVSPHQYEMQTSHSVEEGKLRPDCVVKLTSGQLIVIDSKTPLNSYEDSLDLEDETAKKRKLTEHANNVKARIGEVAKYDQMDKVMFKVMYLPIEASLNAALSIDPSISQFGFDKKVLVATPTTLFALLQVAVLDWRQEDLRRNAEEIANLGKEMVDRVRVVSDHLRKVGTNLATATRSYNDAVSSIERNLYTTATKFQKLGTGREVKVERPIAAEVATSAFQKPDLNALPDPARMRQLEAQDDLFAQELDGDPSLS